MRKIRIAERENGSQEFRIRTIEVYPNPTGREPRTVKEAIEFLHQQYGPTRKLNRKQQPSE